MKLPSGGPARRHTSDFPPGGSVRQGPLLDRWTGNLSRQPGATTQLRLFCFPFAGGGASAFREWPAAMPAGVELCPIQLPGRESRWNEPSFSQLSSLVETLAQVLHPLLTCSFAFFGHSMGAAIAFELARQLRRETGESPAHLFVSGAHAPQRPDRDPPIHGLPNSAFLAELKRLNGISDEVFENQELMQVLLPAFRADITLCETYVYTPDEPLDCPISAYLGEQDRKVALEDLLGWSVHTRRIFRFSLFPGDHFFLVAHRQSLLRVLSAELKEILKHLFERGVR